VSWRGRFFEDFESRGCLSTSARSDSAIRRQFLVFAPDAEYGAVAFRRALRRAGLTGAVPLVDSTFTLALVTGAERDGRIAKTWMANLGWDRVRLPNPVFEGDTIYSQTEVLSRRESASRPDVGTGRRADNRLQSAWCDRDHLRADACTSIGEMQALGWRCPSPVWDERSRRANGIVMS